MAILLLPILTANFFTIQTRIIFIFYINVNEHLIRYHQYFRIQFEQEILLFLHKCASVESKNK